MPIAFLLLSSPFPFIILHFEALSLLFYYYILSSLFLFISSIRSQQEAARNVAANATRA